MLNERATAGFKSSMNAKITFRLLVYQENPHQNWGPGTSHDRIARLVQG